MNAKTALYRCYNCKEELIYVGVTRDPIMRMAKHKISSTWTHDVVLIGVEWFETRAEAFIAEANTIKKEQPIFNIMHNKMPKFNIKDCNAMVYQNIFGENIIFVSGEPVQVISDNDLAEVYETAQAIYSFTKRINKNKQSNQTKVLS